MRINRSLLDDMGKIYYSMICMAEYACDGCKKIELCKTIRNLIISIRKFY